MSAGESARIVSRVRAKALARKVAARPPARLYVSPMGRAQATAAYRAEATGLEPVTLPWLHELAAEWVPKRWAWSMPGAELRDRDTSPRCARGRPLHASSWIALLSA